jgi:hypothetical protein
MLMRRRPAGAAIPATGGGPLGSMDVDVAKMRDVDGNAQEAVGIGFCRPANAPGQEEAWQYGGSG